MKVGGAAIDFVQKLSKSELPLRFFGRLKFAAGAENYGREIHGGPARMAGWAGGPGHVTPMIKRNVMKDESNKSPT